jgi:hypothetical protein
MRSDHITLLKTAKQAGSKEAFKGGEEWAWKIPMGVFAALPRWREEKMARQCCTTLSESQYTNTNSNELTKRNQQGREGASCKVGAWQEANKFN